MTQFTLHKLKDLGLQREVMEALPYAVVGGAWEGSFTANYDKYTALTHVVPSGQQLKILFLRVWTQDPSGAKFSIVQTNPTKAGQTGGVEAYPVVGSVPEGVRDYPMLEAAGAEVIGPQPLNAPIHVLEGSINFNVLYAKASPYHYGIVFWGVQKTPE
jgi:hypothetical protein